MTAQINIALYVVPKILKFAFSANSPLKNLFNRTLIVQKGVKWDTLNSINTVTDARTDANSVKLLINARFVRPKHMYLLMEDASKDLIPSIKLLPVLTALIGMRSSVVYQELDAYKTIANYAVWIRVTVTDV